MAKASTVAKLVKDEPPTWVKTMVGNKFGRLSILEAVGHPNRRCHYYVRCICECGNEVIAAAQSIKAGSILSCNCLRIEKHAEKTKTHGETPYRGRKNKVFNAWMSIKDRCFNKNEAAYYNYGGRGVTMCDGLRYSYPLFKEKLGTPSTETLTVDRKDNDKNYSCGACQHCLDNEWEFNLRWADRFVQANNKRNNVWGYVGGELLTAAQAARKLGVRYGTDFIKKFKSGKYK